VLVEQTKNIETFYWNQVSKYNSLKYFIVYVWIFSYGIERSENSISFLIFKNTIVLCSPKTNICHSDSSREGAYAEVGSQRRNHFDQTFAVLVEVGDLIKGPKKAISPGMRLPTADHIPLIGRQFFHDSFLHTAIRKRSRP